MYMDVHKEVNILSSHLQSVFPTFTLQKLHKHEEHFCGWMMFLEAQSLPYYVTIGERY